MTLSLLDTLIVLVTYLLTCDTVAVAWCRYLADHSDELFVESAYTSAGST